MLYRKRLVLMLLLYRRDECRIIVIIKRIGKSVEE